MVEGLDVECDLLATGFVAADKVLEAGISKEEGSGGDDAALCLYYMPDPVFCPVFALASHTRGMDLSAGITVALEPSSHF